MLYCVYIIQSKKDGSYCTGITADLRKRIVDHNTKLSKYTATKAPYVLKWYCVFPNKKRALEFEKYLKSGSGFAFARKRFL